MLRQARYLGLAGLVALVGCFSTIDSREHCVQIRMGKVANAHMSTGFIMLPVSTTECFTLTKQNFPQDPETPMMVEAQTADNLTISVDIAIEWSYIPEGVFDVFVTKGNAAGAEVIVYNAMREGTRGTINGWTTQRIFSAEREQLGVDLKASIQAEVGALPIIIHEVFVRGIEVPQAIEDARTEAVKQDQYFQQAQRQFQIDSVNARATIVKAEADAREKQLLAQAYSTNPQLLEVEIAKAIAGICGNATTCIVGGSVADLAIAGLK